MTDFKTSLITEENRIPSPDILRSPDVPALARLAAFLNTNVDEIPQSLKTEAVPKSALYEFCKRLLDIVFSATLLLLILPLLLCIAVAIKLTSRGPVLFKQRRLGKDGKLFLCYKFRTMIINAEELLQKNPALRAQFESSFKLKNDPRITPIGGFLRKMSLDELPQFINVLLGDMSLIGPRPIVPAEIAKYGVYGNKFLSVKPGMSGMWQALGRSDTSYSERITMDMMYIDHRALWLDIRLVLITAVAVLLRRGAC